MRLRGEGTKLGYSERVGNNGRTYRNLDVYSDGAPIQLSVREEYPDVLAAARDIPDLTAVRVDVEIVTYRNGATALILAGIAPVKAG